LNQAARQEAPIHWAPPQNMPVRKKGLQLACWGVLCNVVPFLWGLLVVKHLSRLETDSLHLPCATFIITLGFILTALLSASQTNKTFCQASTGFYNVLESVNLGEWKSARFILPICLTCGCLKGNMSCCFP
jgi:hypothetical protein